MITLIFKKITTVKRGKVHANYIYIYIYICNTFTPPIKGKNQCINVI